MNQDGLKLNGSHQLLFYADDDVISGGNVHAINKTLIISRCTVRMCKVIK